MGSTFSYYKTIATNLFLSFSIFTVCRIFFLVYNLSYFPDISTQTLISIFKGGVAFDIAALCYTNALYIVLMCIPLIYRYNLIYQKFIKWTFLIPNIFAIVMNMADVVYFRFTGKRTTASIFKEFSNESNILTIFTNSILTYIPVTIISVVIIYALIKLYRSPKCRFYAYESKSVFYIVNAALLGLVGFLFVTGIRGGIGKTVRPITISNANQYINKPIESAIVLNTPFSVIRTIGKKVFDTPSYFQSINDAQQVVSALHIPKDSTEFKPLNVVVFIVESFGREYIGSLNKDLDNGNYKGYTPFIDSLLPNALSFEKTFSNGNKSIDGMPAILSGIPMIYEPYFLSHYSTNAVSSIAGELNKKGYYSAFFHGAPNGSMGFEAFSNISGYKDYFGMTEYNKANPGNADFDGTWSIWDEEFFQFFAETMSSFPEPFTTAIFSASSHDPFKIPERYKDTFPEGNQPIHKCIRYTDYALKRFFETASKQPWFNNTLFVITADHTNQADKPEFFTEVGRSEVPVIFYYPGGDLKGIRNEIAQQIDIMPSVLGYLGYDNPFISFGRDLFNTTKEDEFAIHFANNAFTFMKDNKVLIYDGSTPLGLYDYTSDRLLKNNLVNVDTLQTKKDSMLLMTQAIVQQYIERMNTNQLVIKEIQQ